MKKAKTLIILVLILIVSLQGQIIKNSDQPQSENWDFQLEKIWKISGNGKDDFGRIQQFQVAQNGSVYVLDSKLKKIQIFNKDGKFLSEFGKMGEGPGEFKTLNMGRQMFLVDNNLIFVERGRILYFSMDGEFKKTVTIPGSITPREFISKDILISAPRIVGNSNQKVKKIKSFNLLNKTESVIATFTPYLKSSNTSDSNGTRTIIAIIIQGITPVMNVTYKNGNLFYGMTDKYIIAKRNLKTQKESQFVMEGRKKKNVSQKLFDQISQNFRQIPKETRKKILANLPKKAAFWQRILVRDNDLIYIFASDPNSASSQAIDIFSPKGKYLYRAKIKIEEENNLRGIEFSKSNLFLSFENEDGEIKLAKYQIKNPNL